MRVHEKQNKNLYKSYTTDVLVIGKGLAGMRAAFEAARADVKVTVVSKCGNASMEVMGFNAVMDTQDSPDRYFEDLMESGAGINNSQLARILAGKAGEVAVELQGYGVVYDLDEDGGYNTMLTLGSSYPRLIHQGAYTGLKILNLLTERCEKKSVAFKNDVMITTLLRDGDEVIGAGGFDLSSGEFIVFWAKAVVLAAGGCGDMHSVSTYPKGIVGDGYAMALEAGAELIDMEFLQYEPCCFIYPEVVKGKLAVTTLLMEGGELRNNSGEEFVRKASRNGYSVQKNELTRLILQETMEGRGTRHGGVYYDVTAVPEKRLKVDNEIFYKPALNAGIDLAKEYAEVAPVAHTCLGGVRIDTECATSVAGLFAAGEVTGGIHGANRIGGCSGAETLVFGAIAGKSAVVYAKRKNDLKISQSLAEHKAGQFFNNKNKYDTPDKNAPFTISELRSQISLLADEKIGISRSKDGLNEALDSLSILEKYIDKSRVENIRDLQELYQVKNIITTARLQVESSLLRKESRGTFFRSDFPVRNDDEWNKNIVIKKTGNSFTTEVIDNINIAKMR